jgi:GNAT superfamily N-acetyltransferase
MNDIKSETYKVAYDPVSSKKGSKFVVRGFLSPAELPQAVLRMFLTKEAVLYLIGPMLLLALSYVVPPVGGIQLPQILLGITILWLFVGVVVLLMLGKNRAIALYDGDKIVGGIRLKVSRRCVYVAGVFVDSTYRGRGMFAALLKASFELTLRSMGEAGVDFTVFAPAHPASKKIVQKYFKGKRIIRVADNKGEEFAHAWELLDKELAALSQKGVNYEFSLKGDFFSQ